MTSTHRRTIAAIAGAAVLVVGIVMAGFLRGDGDDTGAARPTAAASPTPAEPAAPVVVPGRPGESASVLAPDQIPTNPGQTYNTMDTWFLRMMIPHHTQALQMATLAADRAENPGLVAIADRIRSSQAPEILVMRAWLEARGIDADAAGHGHQSEGMAGMQTPEAMRDLAAARGADFDRKFVAMMISHHEGAIRMATDVLRAGIDVEVEKLANDVAAEQAAEITRMRALLPT
ncbi:DUF305 domain-containing protein [Polymorphospora sp. NPDC051019]|uniref:DUF305 domain-containing protein n=1 Tax=Polymorphospora sp. NPDC051019 TaxID=3155725 RepID=UPI003444D79B